VAHDLSNLAALLRKTERLAEAEPLMRRALAIEEAAVGPDHPRVAVHLNNLAQVLVASGRAAEAEPLMRRSLAIDETRFGPNHPNVARNLNNLAQLLKDIDRMEESEPMLQRALTILESNYGPNHPSVAELLSNLALLYKDRGRMDDAEKAMRRTLAIFEAGLGPEHPHVAIGLGNLALLRAERGDWADALNLTRRSAAIRTADIRRNAAGSPEATQRFALASSGDYKFLVLSNYRSRAATREGLAESFLAAQRALATDTAAALAQASARFAAGSGGLAETVRAMQDASRQREAADQQLLAALAKGDAPATSSARAEQAKLDAKLDEIAARLAKDYPDYAGLANPEPLSIEAVQRLLKPDEALVQFLSLPAVSTLPESGFVWVITKTEARWAQLRHGQVGLSAWVSVLRCGLDATLWTDASNWPEATEDDRRRKKEQTDKRTRCTTLMQMDARDDEPPPFDLSRAHELYTMLFGPIEETIKGKQLLIVPSGALTSLPFQTLVTAPPAVAIPESGADYARAAWLGQRQALTVLPSVASLSGLRGITRTSRAQEPFAGFGNPLLTGPFGGDNSAFAKQSCAKPGMETRPLVAMRAPSVAGVDLADVETLRRQSPLPETADELCAVSSMLGATPASVHLGQDATEETVKRLSQDGSLAKAQIVHFATHGLLAGETQQVASAVAEPALLLTPPDKGTETDDGLLTASEVAQLQLDADWVVLSACNTATASETGAEDLSGLARAFFYAGARALLVSHWYVDSTATVALITRTFAALKADPRIGRAEALRRAMTGLLTEPGRGHPAKWAPFVVVGEGGASAR
jgi:CHAT domain-containing protein